jgi:hypothetical protein
MILFRLGNPKIIPSGFLSIGPGFLLGCGSTGVHAIKDLFGFLSGLIQEIEVCGILDISRHTGGIKEELAFRGWGLACSLLVATVIVWLFICGGWSIGDQPSNGLVDRS